MKPEISSDSARQRNWARPESKQVYLVILLTLVFYATSLREGHDWGGDYSQYLLHAQTFIEGRDYTDLGYLYTPEIVVGPRAYPPGYPAVLAPVLYLFGLNFVALKSVVLVFLAIAFVVYWHWARSFLPSRWALGAVLFLAVSPWLLKFSNLVLSDIPSLAMSLLSLYLIHRCLSETPDARKFLYVALSLILACSFRTASIVLVGSLVLYALLFRRSHFVGAIGVAAASFVGVALMDYWFKCGSTYLDHPSLDPLDILRNVWRNLPIYKRGLLLYLAPYPSKNESSWIFLVVNNAALLVYTALAILGIIRQGKKTGVQFHDLYVVAYLGVILCYVFAQKSRYLLPIVPILSLYALIGLRVLLAHLRTIRLPILTSPRLSGLRHLLPVLPTILYVPVFLAAWGYYTFFPVSVGANILANPNIADLFESVRSRRDEINGVIFDHPRVLRLFTDVGTATCQSADRVEWDYDRVVSFSRTYGMSHAIVGPHDRTLGPIFEANRASFIPVYRNPEYRIYRIAPNIFK